jgi:N utilization substance protein A
MKSDFYTAIAQISAERGIPKEAVVSSVEHALKTAFRRVSGGGDNVVVRIDPGSGEARVFLQKVVVEDVENDKLEISLAEARRYEQDATLGSEVMIEDTPKDFGRIAAQTAKQVILQQIREYERRNIYEEFKDRVGEVVTGVIQRADNKAVVIEFGKAEAVMPAREQVPTERYRPGQRIKVRTGSAGDLQRRGRDQGHRPRAGPALQGGGPRLAGQRRPGRLVRRYARRAHPEYRQRTLRRED